MSLKKFSLLDTIKYKQCLARLCYRPGRTGQKMRGCSTFGHSNDLQAFRSQGGGEYTQVGSNRQGLCLGSLGRYTPVMDRHSTEDLKVPHTFSVCYRDILENHIHIASSALIYSIIHTYQHQRKRFISLFYLK